MSVFLGYISVFQMRHIMHTCYGWRSDSCILIVATRLDVVSLYILVLILEKMLFKVTKKKLFKVFKDVI